MTVCQVFATSAGQRDSWLCPTVIFAAGMPVAALAAVPAAEKQAKTTLKHRGKSIKHKAKASNMYSQ